MNLTRRSFASSAAAVLALPLSDKPAHTGASSTVLALYDHTIPSGKVFAGRSLQRKVTAVPISGDRIRFLRAAVSPDIQRIAGVTKYADFLLLSDVARELGFQVLAEMHTRRDGSTVTHSHTACTDLSLFGMKAAAVWPAVFADLALAGRAPATPCSRPRSDLVERTGSAWILDRRI
jgi:hypothetical protein